MAPSGHTVVQEPEPIQRTGSKIGCNEGGSARPLTMDSFNRDLSVSTFFTCRREYSTMIARMIAAYR
jgi:hypothetical protein